jgi:hypothetical protein
MLSSRYCALAALVFAASLHAQTPAPMQKAEPMASQPSAFAGYRMFSEKNPLLDWRGANDFVGVLEGHMGHVRGAPRMMKPAPMPMADRPVPAAAPMAPKPTPSAEPSKPEMKKP